MKKSKLTLHPTPLAQWHCLIGEAQQTSKRLLTEPLESYLVYMLMRFCKRPDAFNHAMALELLATNDMAVKDDKLRDVGDKCLLVSGLFPGIIEKRNVSSRYYVDLGRDAYSRLAHYLPQASAELYQHLCQFFLDLMNVLQAIDQTYQETTQQGLILQPSLITRH
ncbi:MAG: hypothetical protein JKY93_05370 [Gammaproteobacteria bacterium]|nr:hypothetical protein [Gammaproteobacteria bacterium]